MGFFGSKLRTATDAKGLTCKGTAKQAKKLVRSFFQRPNCGSWAKSPEQPCYTLEQVETILSAEEGQLRSILEALAFTGMRIGELVWLTWNDVDFENGFIQVRPKENWKPKNGRPRAIPMHDRVRAVLRQLPRKHRWVFTAEPSKKYLQGGHRISRVHTLEKLKKLLGKLGLEATCTHSGTSLRAIARTTVCRHFNSSSGWATPTCRW